MIENTLYTIKEEIQFPVNCKTKKVTYTIKEDMIAEFNKIIEENNMNKSGVISTLMSVFVDNFKKQKLKLA